MKVFDECCICRQWSSLIKYIGGLPYCPIHLNRKREEKLNRNKAEKHNNWLAWFRAVKESNPGEVNQIS